jgi:hypothetical protein
MQFYTILIMDFVTNIEVIGLILYISIFVSKGINENHPDPYICRLSAITVIYNHFGFAGYLGFQKSVSDLGKKMGYHLFYDQSVALPELQKILSLSVPTHWNIRDLLPYSSLVRFIVPARIIFMKHFQKNAERFSGIEGEALSIAWIIVI